MKSGEILNLNIETENFGAKGTMQMQQGKMRLKEDELGEQLTFNNTDPFMVSE